MKRKNENIEIDDPFVVIQLTIPKNLFLLIYVLFKFSISYFHV